MKRHLGVSLLAAALLVCTGQSAIAAGSLDFRYQGPQQPPVSPSPQLPPVSNVAAPTKFTTSFDNKDLYQMGLIHGSYFLDTMSDYDEKQAIDADKIYATFVFKKQSQPAVLIADFEADNHNDIVACMDALRSTHFMEDVHATDEFPYHTEGRLEVQGYHLADIPISMLSQNAYGPLYLVNNFTSCTSW